MPLKTARVPVELEPLFLQAEKIVSAYFQERSNAPSAGRIEIAGERYVLVRAASLSVEFFKLVEKLFGEERKEEARTFSQNILFDLAHAIGKSDAKSFHTKMNLVDPAARLSAGPIHFSHSGWAFVDIDPASNPQPNEEFFLLYEHPYSFESDAWLEQGRASSFPVCIMNAGYSSGWCEESFGIALVSSEILCRGRGDSCCRFIMAPPDKMKQRVADYIKQEDTLTSRQLLYEVPDLFARKAMEEELREYHRQLEARVEERTRELSRVNEQLLRESSERELIYQRLLEHQHLEALGRLAGGIAHDFNNLLGVIVGCGSMLQRRLDPESSEYGLLQQINEASQSATGLTRQLVTFSRGERAEKQRLDLNQFVLDLVPMLQRVLEKNIDLQLRLSTDAVTIEANGGQLEQLFFNLFMNAKDAMPGGGTLRLTTEVIHNEDDATSSVAVRIQDDGTGMNTYTQARAFDPFFTTKNTGQARGLGLALVYSIVTSLEGNVSIESAPGEGCCFHIVLPVHSENASTGENLAPSHEPS